MKSRLVFVLLSLFAAGAVARGQVLLEDFSNVAGPGTLNAFYGTWEATGVGPSANPNANFIQGAGTFTIGPGGSGIVPTNSAASKLELNFSSVKNIGGNTSLSITAQRLGTNAASSFIVYLIDSLGGSAYAAFSTASFSTSSLTTVTGSLTFLGLNTSSLETIVISGGQPVDSATFGMTFDQISATSAIPEPSTYAALAGLGALGLAVITRRRRIGRSAGGSAP